MKIGSLNRKAKTVPKKNECLEIVKTLWVEAQSYVGDHGPNHLMGKMPHTSSSSLLFFQIDMPLEAMDI